MKQVSLRLRMTASILLITVAAFVIIGVTSYAGTIVPFEDFEAPLQALLSKTVLAIAIAIALIAGLLIVLLNREIILIRKLVTTNRDIIEQKQVQADLIKAKQEAEDANQMKGEFVARISHEIRTPLSGIIGLAQLMQKTAMNDIQKDYLDKMLSSSYAMLAIINEILDFSKVEAGKLELESISFSPEWLLGKVADMIGVFLIEKDQFDFIVEVEDSLPGALLGDPTRLEQILLNLCFNAIKFTEKGHVILKVEGSSSSDNTVEVRFSVEDTGIGMTAMQIERLFTPYTQGDDSTSRKYGGTGLGLFISKSLIEMMGGTLEVVSEPGQGSCFYFILRLQAGIGNEREVNMLLPKEFRHHPVWLVEDGPRMRTHLSRIIAGFSLQAVEFAAWKEALESLLEGNAPEGTVMLLDMEATDMFGHETFYELRQAAAKRGVYTLAMTSAYGREELNRMPPSLKPDGILVKPIHRIDLHQALLSLFDGKQSEPASMKNKSPDPAPLLKGRILLADDYEINRQVAITLLESHGYEVKVALNGFELLTMLEESGWDLILMDIQMPKMDGREATRRIRQDPRFEKLPIIAMTAYATTEELTSFLEVGMNDALIKPIEEGPLLAAIDQLLAKSRSRKLDAAKKQPAGQEEIPIFLENLAGIQAKDALTRINGKVPIFMHMLQTFKRDFSDHEKKIREAYEQGEQQELMHFLHSLRGAAGTISARDLYMAAGRLEDFFESDPDDEAQWSRLLDEVSSALREIIGSLEQLDD
ncbi:response regulator [Paenibacillus sp. GP183]|uniref:response regulator n=1 Tax=Paenibacillus sp. GP183 TaxID=1882751 RepID=UPI001495DC15|nr:response regulator [Paenibacillus sp. GP183]